MTQSKASKLANIVSKDLVTPNNTDNRIGIGSTVPGSTLSVGGTITADSFFTSSGAEVGSGGGIGTAVSSQGPGKSIYYVDTVLGIGETVNIDLPDTSNIAYVINQEIAATGDADIIVADGDDFILDVLGLSTEGTPGPLPGAGGRIRVGEITGPSGLNAPTFPNGVNLSGVVTATSFNGDLTGNADTATTSTNAQGLAGTPNIVVGSVEGTTGSFSGSVSIGGTLTYEDVTNVDSIGVVTARSGIRIGTVSVGGTVGPVGSGIVTYYGDGQYLTGVSAGITTTESSPSANTVVLLDLSSAQHHDLTLTAGITTISCTGGAFGESHSVVLTQPSSGIATVGFSTYFLFPSGSTPSMSEGGGKIDLISFVVKQAGAGGTELLASAGLNYQ